MMERCTGRVALVTGASAGIGAEICKSLVKEGMKVVGCARNVDKINKLSEELKAQKLLGSLEGIRCDLSEKNEIVKMFEYLKKRYNGLHVCINNAGLGFDALVLSGQTEQWQQMFDINVMAMGICTKEAWKLMKEAGIDDGHFVHINSAYTFGSPVIESSHYYAATKCMVNSLVQSQIRELHKLKSKTRVSQVSPGAVQTEFAYRKYDEENAKKFYETVSCLNPQDVADAVLYAIKAPAHVNITNVVMNAVPMK